MLVELTLPTLSPTTEYATVLRWLKHVGDDVSAGEVVVEVEEDKATCEIEASVAGVLESVIAVEGDEVRTGGVLALIEPRT